MGRPLQHDDGPLLAKMADFIHGRQPPGARLPRGLIKEAVGRVLGAVYGSGGGQLERATRHRLLRKWGVNSEGLRATARMRALLPDAGGNDGPLREPGNAAREGSHHARTAQRTLKSAALQLEALAAATPTLLADRRALDPGLQLLLKDIAAGRGMRFVCDIPGVPVLVGRKTRKRRP